MSTQSFNLQHMSDVSKENLKNIKSKQRRLALKSSVKIIATVIVLGVGVGTAIAIPNPISIGVAAAAASILGGSEGIKHSLKRLLAVSKEKSAAKKNDKETDEMVLLNKVQTRINEYTNPGEVVASAPSASMYPQLRI